MITQSRIDAWVRQVESMPGLAPVIIRQITSRLLELDAMNERLRAENMSLSSGARVREFEKKIAELEFQLELMKRQVGSGGAAPEPEAINLLLYNDRGQLVRFEAGQALLAKDAGQPFARVAGAPDAASRNFGLIAVRPSDELLFVFSSGRVANVPVDDIFLSEPGSLTWEGAALQEPRSMEELCAVLPITRMTFYDQCVQVSRFGYVKKISNSYLKTFISNNNIGKGTKFDFDRILGLVLCSNDDLFVTASKNGSINSQSTAGLPVSLEELVRFKVNDYMVAALVLVGEQLLVALTQDGLFLSQKASWLQPAKPGDRRTRTLAAQKKDAALTLAGAAAAGPEDWAVGFRADGALLAVKAGAISGAGLMVSGTEDARMMALGVIPAEANAASNGEAAR